MISKLHNRQQHSNSYWPGAQSKLGSNDKHSGDENYEMQWTTSYKGVMTSNHITNWFSVELYPGVASKSLLICDAWVR